MRSSLGQWYGTMLLRGCELVVGCLFLPAVDKGAKRRKKNKATADHFKQVLFMLCTLFSGNGSGSRLWCRKELGVAASLFNNHYHWRQNTFKREARLIFLLAMRDCL